MCNWVGKIYFAKGNDEELVGPVMLTCVFKI